MEPADSVITHRCIVDCETGWSHTKSVSLVPIANGKYHKPVYRIAAVLCFSALAIWFFSFYVIYQYDAARPNRPNHASGQVYAQNNHGHIVYLTRTGCDEAAELAKLDGTFRAMREYLRAIFDRYQKAGRKSKKVILSEFCANTAYNRKYDFRPQTKPFADPRHPQGQQCFQPHRPKIASRFPYRRQHSHFLGCS
jgi:hypothetical protein